MSMIAPAPALVASAGQRLLRPLAFVFDAWRQLTWKHFLYTFLICIAATNLGRSDALVSRLQSDMPYSTILWVQMRQSLVYVQLQGFSILLAVAVADQWSAAASRRWVPAAWIHLSARTIAQWSAAASRRWVPYFLALVIGAAAGVFLEWLALVQWARLATFWGVSLIEGRFQGNPIFFLHQYLHVLLYGGMVTFIYVNRRRAAERLAALRAKQLERTEVSRALLESRLQAMQARVEPQFLFNTLAQVARLYETDRKLAEQMLDDLIRYLRAVLPQMRGTTSTLGQEMELVRAYLNIMKVRLQDRLAFDIRLPEDLTDARIPPMVLLPLVDHAIVYGLEPSKQGGTIEISAVVENSKLKLTIADSGTGFVPREPDADGIQCIRERLDALYGKDASLALEHNKQQGTQAVMEIPYERTDSSDR